jgi:hypothetical protein
MEIYLGTALKRPYSWPLSAPSSFNNEKFGNLAPNSAVSLHLAPNSRPLQNLASGGRISSRKETHPIF